jgi:hypothetical protein
MADTCSICRYWGPPAVGDNRGNCRRYPPLPLFGTHWGKPGDGLSHLESHFPQVYGTDWCGEFGKIVPAPVQTPT